jgi:hypothetical protein
MHKLTHSKTDHKAHFICGVTKNTSLIRSVFCGLFCCVLICVICWFLRNIECNTHLHGEVCLEKLTLNRLVCYYSPFTKHGLLLLRFCKQYVFSLCNILWNSMEMDMYLGLHEELKKKTSNLFMNVILRRVCETIFAGEKQ